MFRLISLNQNRIAMSVAAFAAVLSLIACGGGSTPASSTATPTAPGTSSAQVRLGDAPADGIVSFEITVNSVVLTASNGVNTSVLGTPTRVEITHLSGTSEPLSIGNVSQGTYSSATITVANPEVTVIDPGTKKPVEIPVALSAATVTVNFSPALTIGSEPAVINFDLDAAASVTINGNTASVTPVFTVSTATPAGEQEQEQMHEMEKGEVEDAVGPISAISGISFTITRLSGASLTFQTDSSTQYHDLTGFSDLKIGLIVEVAAVTKADGSLLAKIIEGKSNGVIEAEGIVTKVSGMPATSFEFVPHFGVASAGTPPALGTAITVTISGSTSFRFDSDHVNLSGLSFTPVFDASTIAVAQKVEVDTETQPTTTIAAKRVRLKVQTVRGTASNVTSSRFTLTVPADSVFTLLSGQTTITVYRPSSMVMKGITSLNNGDTVRVRGLLFFQGGQYSLVAQAAIRP